MQRRLFWLMSGFALLATGVCALAFVWQRDWASAFMSAAITVVSFACGIWSCRIGRAEWPMRVLCATMVVLLGWQTVRQGAGMPAAGWWLSVIPFVLAGAGLHGMAVGAVAVFVAIVTFMFFGPGSGSPGVTPEPARRYFAVVGSELLALGMILTATRHRRAASQAIELARATAVGAAAAKVRFLAHMSHEIRTPLNGIIGTAEMLRSSSLECVQRAQLLDLQERSARTLLTLVNDVLDWTKLQAGRVALEARPLHLQRVVFETNELFAVQASNKGIELTSSCNPDVPRNFIGDATRLRQVIDNLVANAVKFTAHGGVHIHTSMEPSEAWPGATADRRRWVRIEATDSGIGIDPQRMASLFKAFSQGDDSTARRYGGTGLGLAISLDLARLMGGRIDVASEPGRGSTFALVLPLDIAGQTGTVHPVRPRHDVVLASASSGVQRHLNTILHDLGIEPMVVRELPLAAVAASSRLLLVDETLLATLAEPRAWLQRQANEGRRVVVLTAFGSALAVGIPEDVAVLYKPVRRRSLRAVLDALEHVQAAAPAASAPMPSLRIAGPHVLVAEDNAVNQIVVQAMLEELGASCVVAASGSEALQCLATERFDLVLMDVHMPDMDGLTATRQLRAIEAAGTLPRVRVVAMTASAPTEGDAVCREAGMDGFLAKPFGMSDLRAALDAWGSSAE